MARLLLILAVAAVVFTVFTIVDCATQPESRHRGVSKGTWVVITLVPVIGGILWLTIGRARKGQQRPATASGPTGPDDDPGFLTASDERIRKLEEELAMLDAEEQFDAPGDDRPRAADDERNGDDEVLAGLDAQFHSDRDDDSSADETSDDEGADTDGTSDGDEGENDDPRDARG
ncbi:PLD nuclease N-terminal domain-containing protein [Microbacterium sp. G2-8]|uniref:PLD nuclease N-terminal domain-containing protein n=1 Tax=Microbacterium sp. G2-8 TaxID=2842454 RepID=UPI001C8A5109|nr:PLD nuclease N-terminal domain-containing protein [Microbacterium sp. G2-8]